MFVGVGQRCEQWLTHKSYRDLWGLSAACLCEEISLLHKQGMTSRLIVIVEVILRLIAKI